MDQLYSLSALATPLDGWSVGEIELKAFELADVGKYAALSEDPDFHWDREAKPSSFSEFMIRFRRQHYDTYGFGIMGCWLGGTLIGQAGLQVIPEDTSKVEMAVFLGRGFRGRGFGHSLNAELMKRCRSVGMRLIYGVVRSDNTAARALMLKLGGQEVASGIHFGQAAIEFEFQL